VSDSPPRFTDHALLILDQRRLPAEEVWLRCETPDQVAEAIRTLAVRGAPAIGLAAAYGLALADDRDSAFELLLGTRPTAANLRCHGRLRHRRRGAEDRLRRRPARARLGHRDAAAAAGREADGVGARAAGIPFRLVVDSSAGALIASGRVDAVVVGADRIAANGDVANKIGTYPIAALAARHSLPFYVAAPLSTIDPSTPDGGAIPIEERDPAEVADGAPALNLAFDVTPAELVTAIVTERGVLAPPFTESSVA
jgi:methylthioribose-1-phosphate isomerase